MKIVLADDHNLVRSGLRAMLEKRSDVTIVGEAETGRATLEIVHETKPDLVLMDVSMPDMNGIEATKQLLKTAQPPRVIALSMHSDRRYVTSMLKAGVSGYLMKNCNPAELFNALDCVMKGKTYISPEIGDIVVDQLKNPQDENIGSLVASLSAREREVLQLIAEGETTKEIAAKLHVSTKTIESHRKKMMEKLRVNSVALLTKVAVREGLTSLD